MGRSYSVDGSQQVFDGQELLGAFTTPPLQAATNNYSVQGKQFLNASLLLISATTPVNLSGLMGATANRDLTIINVGANTITLLDSSGLSLPANRFNLGGAALGLSASQGVRLIGRGATGWVSAGGGGGGGGGGAPSTATYYTATDETAVLPNSILLPLPASLLVPAKTPDLAYWFQGDIHLVSAGKPALALFNSCPWNGDAAFPTSVAAPGVTRNATQLNGKNAFTWPGAASGRYPFQSGLALPQATIFAVLNPTAFASAPGINISGVAGALQLTQSTGTGVLVMNSASSGVIGSSAIPLVNGAWVQVNATYDDTTGNFAYRIAGAAQGSGTNLVGITSATSVIGFNPSTGAEDMEGSIAEIIIYDRVLTAPEITAIEAYLLAKWGV